jgi:hypothetical protein
MGIVVEEADEAILWLELMTESGIVSLTKTEALLREANELTSIFSASQRTEACSMSFSIAKSPDHTIAQ